MRALLAQSGILGYWPFILGYWDIAHKEIGILPCSYTACTLHFGLGWDIDLLKLGYWDIGPLKLGYLGYPDPPP